MSKTDPYVRDLLQKNQYAEALRYYRTRYKAERPEAMRVLQEIQNELSGKPPAGGIVNASGDPIHSPPAPSIPKDPPPAPKEVVKIVQVAPPEPPKQTLVPPELLKATPGHVVSVTASSYQSPPKVESGAIRNDSHWNSLSSPMRSELQSLLEEDRALDAIRTYWRESPVELRDAKERVLRWATTFPPKR